MAAPITPPTETDLETPTTTDTTLPPEFDAASLDDTTDINIPELPEPEPVEPFVAGLGAGLEAFQAPVDDLEAERGALTEDLTSQLDTLTGEGQALLGEEEALGIPEKQKELAALNLQFSQAKGRFDQQTALESTRKVAQPFIIGSQNAIRRLRAAELGAISSMQQALQGNIANAQTTAQRTIDIKYDAIEQDIRNKSLLLDLNMEKLTRAEQKLAKAEQAKLATKQAKLEADKKRDNDVLGFALEAIQGGADANQARKIGEAKTVFDALVAAAPFLGPVDPEGNWATFTDSDGNPFLFDKNTGNVKSAITLPSGQVTANTSGDFFTDANGTSWNMTGWATDPTKAAQMQATADRIGKLDDSNLDSKVKALAPGITGDMIRQASAASGVSWEAILTTIVQEATINGGMSNVSKKNNNYGGLTWSNNTQWQQQPFGGVQGTARPASEGGNYISFPTKEQGVLAMAELMKQYGTVDPNAVNVDSEVAGFIEQVQSGAITLNQALNEIDEKKKGQLIESISRAPKPDDTQEQELAKSKISVVEALKTDPGLNSSVGPTLFQRIAVADLAGAKDNFISSVDQLVSELSLDKLIAAKAAGATFGALSDSELQLLANAATKIGGWRTFGGFDIDEENFIKELGVIQDFMGQALVNSTSENIKQMEDGTRWEIQPDGSVIQL